MMCSGERCYAEVLDEGCGNVIKTTGVVMDVEWCGASISNKRFSILKDITLSEGVFFLLVFRRRITAALRWCMKKAKAYEMVPLSLIYLSQHCFSLEPKLVRPPPVYRREQ
jgi:hypothetical protein